MKRAVVLTFVLAVLLLVAAVLTPSTQAQAPVIVYPYVDGATYNANTSEPIILYWGWLATTPGLVRVYLNHSEETYLMTGPGVPPLDLDAAEAEVYWGPLVSGPPSVLGLECPMPNLWATFWEYDVGPLPQGVYTLVFTSTFNNPVNDGYHVCTFEGTNIPAAPAPSLFRSGVLVATSTIIVSP